MFKKIKKAYARWVKIGKKIAAWQVKAMFNISYYIILVPLGLFLKFFIKTSAPGWQKVDEKIRFLEEARKQF